MKRKKGKVALIVMVTLIVLGGVSAVAYVNAERIGGLLGIEFPQEEPQDVAPVASEPKTPPTQQAEGLQAYAEQFTYLKGNHYGSYLSKSEEYLCEKDLSEVPLESLGYAIRDLDGDGAEELLVISLEEEYYLKATIYEEVDGAVQEAAQYSLRDEYTGISIDFSEAQKGTTQMLDCYFFGENEIGIELTAYADLMSNGTCINFVALRYQDGTLQKETQAYYAGSDGEEDDSFLDELAKVGIQNASWEKLFQRENYVRDYVSNYEEICGVQGDCLLTYAEFEEQWYYSDNTSPLKTMELYCYTDEEIAAHTKAMGAAKETEQSETFAP